MQLSREQYTYMTDYIKRQYGYSADWCKKVSKMPDDQVFAIFCSMSARQKLNSQNTKKVAHPNKVVQQYTSDVQLTIWDLLNTKGELSETKGNIHPAI